MYNIKEVSELMGISPYTLRYYEKIGLLNFVKRDQNGVRQFSKKDLVTLNTIFRLKETDMPLREIKRYLALIDQGIDSVSERKALMQKQQQKVEQKIAQLQKALVTINAKVKYYQTAEKEHRLDVCHDDREEFIRKIINTQL